MAKPFDLASYIWPEISNGRPSRNAPKLNGLLAPLHLWIPDGGHLLDATGRLNLSTRAANTQYTTGDIGSCIRHNGINSRGVSSESFAGVAGLSELTLFAVGTLRATADSFQHMIRCENAGGTGHFDLGVKFDGVNLSLSFLLNTTDVTGWSAGSFTTISSGGDFKLNLPYVYIQRWKNGEGSEGTVTPIGGIPKWIRCNRDATGTVSTIGSPILCVGGLAYTGSDYSYSGDIYMAGILPYKITDAESAKLSDNPFAVFSEPESNLFYVPAAGGATNFTQSLSGILSLSGSQLKSTSKLDSGSLNLSASTSKISNKQNQGVLSFVGLILKNTHKSVVGALDLQGTLSTIKSILKSITGVLSFSGSIVKAPNKLLLGTLNLLGIVNNLSLKNLVGSLNFSGAVSSLKALFKTITGTLSFSGTNLYQISKSLVGNVNLSGVVNKSILRTIVATLSFSASLSNLKAFFKTLTGALSFTGNFEKLPLKNITASLNLSGSSTKMIQQLLVGTLSFAGALVRIKTILLALSGVLSFNGSIIKRSIKAIDGSLILSGDNVKLTSRLAAGTLNFVGAGTKQVNKITSGVLSFLATLIGNITDLVYHPSIDRTYIVPIEQRIYTVASEDRNYTL